MQAECNICKSTNITDYDLKKCYYYCKPCKSKKLHNLYIKNKEIIKSRSQTRYKKLKHNREYIIKQILSSHRYRDKKRYEQICDFNYLEYVEFTNNPCFYCGEIVEHRGLDRINNDIGHIKINVVPCCLVCNQARSDYFTVEEMKKLGKSIRQIKESRRN